VTDVVVGAPPDPYKGLANYTERDAALFFGRDREREVIIANLKARRLTLLCGESGVGKSSLLRAGVVARLLEVAHENVDEIGTPEFLPVVFANWRDDPLTGLIDAIHTAAEQFLDEAGGRSPPNLSEAVSAAAGALDAYLLIILDQFEEYFLYHTNDAREGTFADELIRAVNLPGLQASFVVSIREDVLAKLDRFKPQIPKLFDTLLRVGHLDAASAREAIVRPVERYNALADADRRVTVEPGLADAVVAQVKTGEVVLERSGQGAPAAGNGREGDQVETPYLQLVMTRLWEYESSAGSRRLRRSTLDELGGAQQIVRTHLDAALSTLSPAEREVAGDLFHHLVTPSGSKIAHAARDLAEYAGRPEHEVDALLEKLAGGGTRIVRPVPPSPGSEGSPRFEIFHDVLAGSILDWRQRQTAARRVEHEKRASRAAMRRRIVAVAILAGLAGLGVLTALARVAISQRDEANRQTALAQELAGFDPSLTYLYLAFGDRTIFRAVRVLAPGGSRVIVTCTQGCAPWTTTLPGHGEQAVTVPNLRRAAVPPGEKVRLLVTGTNIGQLTTFTALRRRAPTRTSLRCRPPGSSIAASEVPAGCL
jgi:hypothetical protein